MSLRLPGTLFLNTILLGGGTRAKLDAAHAAGFAQVELWREDVDGLGGSLAGVVDTLRAYPLGLTDYQVLRDVDGAASAERAGRREAALRMMDDAVALGATVVQAPSNTRDDVVAARIPEDLSWLASEASIRGLSIAYEPMAWSTATPTLPALWANVLASGAENIDVVIDAFHLFARGRTLADVDRIPVTRIANVQFCDGASMGPLPDAKTTGKHSRLLPGDGVFPLHELASALVAKGYTGPVGIEVFNDTLKQRDPFEVAQEAMASLRRVLTE